MKRKHFLICIILVSLIFIFIGSTFANGNTLPDTSVTIDTTNMLIKNIAIGTSGNELINILNLDENNIKFYRNENEINSNHILITGDKILFNNSNEWYKLSVCGDVLGEGKISINGIKTVARHIINKNILKNEFLAAADYNFNGVVKMNDAISMLKKIGDSTTLTSNPSRINYQSNNNGKFIFINNPEGIRTSFLADSNYGNRLMYKDFFNGNMELYYEHSTYEDISIAYRGEFYYAVKFYNPNDVAVNLTINHAGSSINIWALTWEKYYDDGYNTPQKDYTINPGESLYFYHKNCNSNNYCFANDFSEAYKFSGYVGFDGVMNVTSNGKLYAETLAFNDINKISNATYPGNVDSIDDGLNLRVYSGSVNQMPDLYNNATFVIDDSVEAKTNLKIICSNGHIYDHWRTNYVGAWYSNSASSIITSDVNVYCDYRGDIVPLEFVSDKNTKVVIKPYYTGIDGSTDNRDSIIGVFGRPLQFNVANWAVHYHENITLINNGKKTRTLSFIMSPVKNSTYSIFHDSANASNNINYIEKENKYFTANSTDNVIIWKIEIDPGQTIKVPTIITLGGMSSGLINKFIYVDN